MSDEILPPGSCKHRPISNGWSSSWRPDGDGQPLRIRGCGLLTIAFIVLKLTGVIAWSWVWVLSPLWIGLAVVLAVGLVALIGFGIYKGVKAVRR